MQITLYGTGSCMPSPKQNGGFLRSFSGWYVEVDEDGLLFDIGSGVLHKMLEDGIDILKKPTHIFLSHLHIDHTIDIFQLIQGRAVAKNSFNKDIKTTFIGGPIGTNNLITSDWASYGETFKIEDGFDVKEVSSGIVAATDNWKVTCSPIKHYKDSICYRLDLSGKSIVYSGDMIYDERICELGRDVDIAIMECSYPDRESLKNGNHLCPEDIGNLAKIGGFKKVVLTHMYPVCEGREDEMVKTIKDIAGCEVVVGYDGLKVEV